MDKILGDLGGERILEVTCGDEMFGQEQQFRSWSSNIFHVSTCLITSVLEKILETEIT